MSDQATEEYLAAAVFWRRLRCASERPKFWLDRILTTLVRLEDQAFQATRKILHLSVGLYFLCYDPLSTVSLVCSCYHKVFLRHPLQATGTDFLPLNFRRRFKPDLAPFVSHSSFSNLPGTPTSSPTCPPSTWPSSSMTSSTTRGAHAREATRPTARRSSWSSRARRALLRSWSTKWRTLS